YGLCNGRNCHLDVKAGWRIDEKLDSSVRYNRKAHHLGHENVSARRNLSELIDTALVRYNTPLESRLLTNQFQHCSANDPALRIRDSAPKRARCLAERRGRYEEDGNNYTKNAVTSHMQRSSANRRKSENVTTESQTRSGSQREAKCKLLTLNCAFDLCNTSTKSRSVVNSNGCKKSSSQASENKRQRCSDHYKNVGSADKSVWE